MKYGIGKWETRNGKMAEITGPSSAYDQKDGYVWEGTCEGRRATWTEEGWYIVNERDTFDLIGPWKGKEPQPTLNLMELPVGTWLKLRNGQKRRLCGNDGKYVLVNGGPNTDLVQYHENGNYASPDQISQLDVVAVWQEPKTRTVWIAAYLDPSASPFYGASITHDLSDWGGLIPYGITALRYVKVELVEGEFDDLPVEEK